jgi:ankyrin repeat protein
MTTTLLCLPGEILLAIAAAVIEIPDLAALALANRRLFVVANPALYAAAARDFRATRQALFYSAENGFIEPVRLMLKHGANPNAVYSSPIPRDCLHRVLVAQDRRPGRRPLMDRKLAAECIASPLRGTDPRSDFAKAYVRLASALFGEANDVASSADDVAYSFLIHDLHSIVIQFDDTICESQIELDSSGRHQWTALHVAAHRGDNELIKLLLDSGAIMDARLPVEEKPASLAISEGIAKSSLVPSVPQTPLLLAISSGHDSTAQLLLDSGASTDVSSHGVTALHIAAWHGALGLCKFLVDKFPGLVDERTKAWLTPFHYAVAAGHLQTVGRFLLEKGADMHACFSGPILAGNVLPEWDYSALTHALRTRRYSDALMLVDMDPDVALPRDYSEGHQMNPLQACLYGHNISQSDEDQMIPILRRILFGFDPSALPLPERHLSHYLDEASRHHLPKTVKLLLEVTELWAFPLRSLERQLESALQDARSSAAVETVMALVDYSISVQGMLTPSLSRIFVQVLPHQQLKAIYAAPKYLNIRLAADGAVEARLDILRLLHARLTANGQGIDGRDLRVSLIGACQPGGLPVCEWLAAQGALRHVDKTDLGTMIFRITRSQSIGGNDPELSRWVLAQADGMGYKDWLLKELSIPRMIFGSASLGVAQVLLSEGASPDIPPRTPRRWVAQDSRAVFSCHTRQRVPVWRIETPLMYHVLLMVCLRPDMEGAAELLRLAIADAEGGVKELINAVFEIPDGNSHTRTYTLTSLVCCTSLKTAARDNDTPSEPARLAMLQMLLDAGADVHTLVERDSSNEEVEVGPDAQDGPKPSEALWRAFAAEDEDEIGLQQQTSHAATPSQQPRFHVVKWHKPMRCVILSKMPTLARAMLEARPLPVRNSPVALRYLQAACGEFGRLSPPILELLLGMANLDHADVPLNASGETALMALMRFCKENDLEEAAADLLHPVCRCEPDLIGFEKDDVSKMVCLLLERGAKWNTRSPVTGRSALDELREVLGAGTAYKGIYKIHNIAQLRKHIVLDIHAEGVDGLQGFNPFEMGDVKPIIEVLW